jgi:hypothetical protein
MELLATVFSTTRGEDLAAPICTLRPEKRRGRGKDNNPHQHGIHIERGLATRRMVKRE